MKKTSLYKKHLKSGAKMVDFGGWNMPINYGSQIKEHNAVRTNCGMFDVSHMCIIDLSGAEAKDFLQKLIANDVAKLKVEGKTLYSCMLNENGGVIDDLIVYFNADNNYRLVINSATSAKDIAWINLQIVNFDANIIVRDDLAIIAVQGPNARKKVFESIVKTFDICQNLKPFNSVNIGNLFIARTGYTGEDGFEIILPNQDAKSIWQMLLAAGVVPCGLGARDTLRLEAGMSLYGNEMNEKVSPLQAGLDWTVSITDERDFIGKDKLLKSDQTIKGIVLVGKGVLRAGQIVKTDCGDGIITSGTFSPTMGASIALARINKNSLTCKIEIRGKLQAGKVVKLPFVRNGKILV